MTERREHWDRVYATKVAESVSWYQAEATTSLELIAETGVGEGARIVDVGGGASKLAGNLLARGFSRVAVLDIAEFALLAAKTAMGPAAAGVEWIVADATAWRPAEPFDLWHDRAVFHFLTEPEQRAGYRAALEAGLKPGGWLIMAAFAPDGPEMCSGLPVRRWSAEGLAVELGEGFRLQRAFEDTHTTPWGAPQRFTWALFRRRA